MVFAGEKSYFCCFIDGCFFFVFTFLQEVNNSFCDTLETRTLRKFIYDISGRIRKKITVLKFE